MFGLVKFKKKLKMYVLNNVCCDKSLMPFVTFHQGTLKKHRSIASGPTKLVTDYTVDLARRRSWVDSNLSTLAMSSIFVIDF